MAGITPHKMPHSKYYIRCVCHCINDSLYTYQSLEYGLNELGNITRHVNFKFVSCFEPRA